MAKTAFDADSELARVNVLFYDQRVPNLYDEISVTLGDVKAYAGGQLSKEQLLSTLKLVPSSNATPMTEPAAVPPLPATSQPVAKDVKGESQSNKPTAATVAPQKVAIASPAPRTAEGLVTYRSNYGVTLNYPGSWKAEYPRSGNTVIRFNLPARTFGIVEMQIYSDKETTPPAIVNEDPRDTLETLYWMSMMKDIPEPMQAYTTPESMNRWITHEMDEFHEKCDAAQQRYFRGRYSEFKKWRSQQLDHWTLVSPVALPGSLTAGKNKSVRCAQNAYWISSARSHHEHWHSEGMSSMWEHREHGRDFIRMVSFNSHNEVVLLALYCAEDDAGADNAQFEQLVHGFVCAGTANHPATHSAKTKTK
jgi:hypothetical protein